MKLSVIVPVYNSEKYISKCADSILGQTFSDLELILVDDGSADSSGKICDDICLKDNRVRVFHKENGGVSSARNFGLDKAEGEYIAFVDSDDTIDSQMYEKLFAALGDNNDIALCDLLLCYSDSVQPAELYNVADDKVGTISNFLLSGLGGSSVNMVSRRRVIGEQRFPDHLRSGEDALFVLKLLCKANSVAKVSEPLYHYNRENESSITRTLSTKDLTDTIDIYYGQAMAYLKDFGLFQDVRKAFYRACLRFKTAFVMSPSLMHLYREKIPEANRYVIGNPLLSAKMKVLMILLNLHADKVVAWTLKLLGRTCR